MFMKDANKLLDAGYQPMETGFTKLDDGSMLIAVLTRMPGATGKMVEWWFGWAGDTEKYKLWHPTAHLVGDWDDKWAPGQYIGASHLVHETLGDSPEVHKLKITFYEPSEVLDTSRFEEANVGVAVCGKVGLLEEDVQLGNLMHFVRDTEFGCEMRSRFWLAEYSEEMGRNLMQHCIEEMGYLAGILPDLYKKESGK